MGDVRDVFMSSPPVAGPSNQGKTFDTNTFIWDAICNGLIDMHELWFKGSKYKSNKVCERGFQTSVFLLMFCFQYQRLQLMYNISNEGDNFVVYRNAKHAESLDELTWRNARCAQQACMNCKKQENTSLCKVIDLYGDVDLRACIWCLV